MKIFSKGKPERNQYESKGIYNSHKRTSSWVKIHFKLKGAMDRLINYNDRENFCFTKEEFD